MKGSTEIIRRRYDRVAGVYDFMERPMEAMLFRKSRAEMLRGVSGRVLEVGVGTGKNLEFYSESADVTAIDFSPRMLEKAKKRQRELGRTFNLQLMDAQNLEFADGTFDAVVATCVFCSVPDPVRGFEELRRVTKKEGRIFLIEHMRSEGRIAGFIMDLLNAVVVNLYGANINRRTVDNIRMAGFSRFETVDLWRDIVKKITIMNA